MNQSCCLLSQPSENEACIKACALRHASAPSTVKPQVPLPRQRAIVGSYEGGVSYVRGTPATPNPQKSQLEHLNPALHNAPALPADKPQVVRSTLNPKLATLNPEP